MLQIAVPIKKWRLKSSKARSNPTKRVSQSPKRWGIKTRSLSDSHKVYYLNENYFEKIDTEEKAYWLGFIYADGYITGDKLGISLAKCDKEFGP